MGRGDGPQARGRKAGTCLGRLGPALVQVLILVLNPVPSAGQESPIFTETKLTASDAAVRDFFGRRVAISGGTAVVGATQAAGEEFGAASPARPAAPTAARTSTTCFAARRCWDRSF